MLNRKLSNYIYYGIVAAVTLLVIIIRVVVMNNVNGDIDSMKRENTTLDQQITALNEDVQTYYNYQSDVIYDLYKEVPNVYNEDMLEFKITSKLELLGISEDEDFQRKVTINPDTTISVANLSQYKDKYGYVEIQVSFTISSIQTARDFLDSMYNDDQMFILNRVTYAIPDDESSQEVGIVMYYYAFYADDSLNEYN